MSFVEREVEKIRLAMSGRKIEKPSMSAIVGG